MTINLNQISPEHREQVERFLTHYPRTGQQLAENYLALVTSHEYRTNSGYQKQKREERPAAHREPKAPKAEASACRKRSIILGEISSDPGQSGKQIAEKTGLSLHSIRQILLHLSKEGLIEGFTKGRTGYYLSGEISGEIS